MTSLIHYTCNIQREKYSSYSWYRFDGVNTIPFKVKVRHMNTKIILKCSTYIYIYMETINNIPLKIYILS